MPVHTRLYLNTHTRMEEETLARDMGLGRTALLSLDHKKMVLTGMQVLNWYGLHALKVNRLCN